MALIKTIEPEDASGELATLYKMVERAFGRVPNAFKLLSISPELLKQQVAFTGYYGKHPTLSAPLLTCMRMLVSQQSNCAYCIDLNAGLLINMMGWTPEQVAATCADVSQANLPERERALLALVLKSVQDSNSVTAADMNALRELGWSDGDIVDGLFHGARMLAADILLNALQVERDF